MADLLVCNLGLVPYREGVRIQHELRARVAAGELDEVMLLLEHPPVYTLGRRSDAEDLPLSDAFLAEQGIERIETERGGKVTYHGPGQLVGYPIMRLRDAMGDVMVYLRTMERALITALTDAGIDAHAGDRPTGVWVADRKIASIGVHVSRGVTAHGFAVNVTNSLTPFEWVVACGLPDVRMTSVAVEQGPDADVCGLGACMRKRVGFRFAEAHGRRQRLVGASRLGIELPVP